MSRLDDYDQRVIAGLLNDPEALRALVVAAPEHDPRLVGLLRRLLDDAVVEHRSGRDERRVLVTSTGPSVLTIHTKDRWLVVNAEIPITAEEEAALYELREGT